MTKFRRIAPLAAVLAIAVVGFLILRPDDSKKKTGATTTGTPVATTPAGKTTPVEPAKPPVPKVTVKGGKPVGGVKKISANKGDRLVFVVQSDVADEIHVHGYDVMKDVEAGGKVRFAFKATIDGIFEVELEDRGEQIAELEVDP
jgi:hypothetical protein